MNIELKIGTRESKLAVWQTEYVAELLQHNGFKTSTQIIETKGDKILDRSLFKIGSKGVFTEELEQGLSDGSLHLAIHSAKDLQSTLPENLEIIAYTKREIPDDVMVGLSAEILKKDNLKIGTSSTRRRAFVNKYFPHAELVEMRGNLQTRFKKLEEGATDVMILAYAGVHRMGYDNFILKHLNINEFIPPVGQGSIAVQCNKNLDVEVKQKIKKILNDEATENCLLAERSFLRKLDGGCSVPVYAHGQIYNNQIDLKGGVISLDGAIQIQDEITGNPNEAEFLGSKLAQSLINKGANELLKDIRSKLQ